MDSRMYRVTFVDRDEALVGSCRGRAATGISFFGNRNRNVVVNGYEAYVVGDQEAERRILEADYIFYLRGEENLREAGAWLGKNLGRRAWPRGYGDCGGERDREPGTVGTLYLRETEAGPGQPLPDAVYHFERRSGVGYSL